MGRITEALDPERQVHRFAYDAASNLVQRQTHDDLTKFTWDEQNRLKTVHTPDGRRIDMTYDALGRRHIKAVNGERTFFTWDGDALLSEQYEDGPPREYVYYPGTFEPLALIDGDGSVYYYHNDLNGLPQELTKPNGEIVWSASYNAKGRVDQLLVDEVAQPLRFQGQYWDAEIDLCYNRYRYYDPQICAFISQEPLGLAAGENVYAYAPNVWGWIDPLGLACNPIEGIKKRDFKKLFGIVGKKRLQSNWDQYRWAPDKFFRRDDVQNILKARGRVPYTPSEKALITQIKASNVFEWSKGETLPAKSIQFTVELFNDILMPPNSKQIYDTGPGKVGNTIGSAIGDTIKRQFGF